MSIQSESARKLLHFAELPGVGVAALRKIVEGAGSVSELPQIDELRERTGKLDQKLKTSIIPATKILEDCSALGISILSPLDPEYPNALRAIDDYPAVLYVKGALEAIQNTSVAVVGTRNASKLGLSWARQISEMLCSRGITVVSGLALGIDTAAHEGALRGLGPTVAILAHGLDKASPVSNKVLADDILNNGGAWMSEHAPGVPARRAEFVRRNRLQSGMSVCSIVVESGEVGGAIHQGNFTQKQGRKLMCVVPDRTTQGADKFNYGGAKRLISEMNAVALSSSAQLSEFIDSGMLSKRFSSFTPTPQQESFL